MGNSHLAVPPVRARRSNLVCSRLLLAGCDRQTSYTGLLKEGSSAERIVKGVASAGSLVAPLPRVLLGADALYGQRLQADPIPVSMAMHPFLGIQARGLPWEKT